MLAARPSARLRTRAIALLALLAAVALAGVCSAPSALAARPGSWGLGQGLPRVDVYGDSLSYLSSDQIVAPLRGRADVVMHVYPGTAICDWLADMRKTAAARPAMVLITFGGNHQGRACVRSTNLALQYQNDAATAVQIFAASRVVLANDPESGVNTIGNIAFDHAYEAAVVGHSNATVAYPGLAVSPGHTFTWTLPCLPSERRSSACHQGRIVVRSSDTVHLTTAGEVRFGPAVAQPAVQAFGLRRGGWGRPVVSRVSSVAFIQR